jgi:hypothetical protein
MGGSFAQRYRLPGRLTPTGKRAKVYPPPELRTSHAELVGTTTGIILTAVVAVVSLAILIGSVYWADHASARRPEDRPPPQARGRGSRTEISPAQGHEPWRQIEDRHVPEGGHPHGKPASWVLVAVVMAAFAAGGVAIIAHAWWLLWTCAGIIVLAIPAGKLIGIMNDTVAWGSTPAATDDSPPHQQADPGLDQPLPPAHEPFPQPQPGVRRGRP